MKNTLLLAIALLLCFGASGSFVVGFSAVGAGAAAGFFILPVLRS